MQNSPMEWTNKAKSRKIRKKKIRYLRGQVKIAEQLDSKRENRENQEEKIFGQVCREKEQLMALINSKPQFLANTRSFEYKKPEKLHIYILVCVYIFN